MKNLHLVGLTVALGLVAMLVMAQSTPPRYSRVENVVYTVNPHTGAMGVYLSFELEPNHRYLFQGTRNGVDFFDLFTEDTTGRVNDTYESFNVEPCGSGIWPRIVDLGSTAP